MILIALRHGLRAGEHCDHTSRLLTAPKYCFTDFDTSIAGKWPQGLKAVAPRVSRVIRGRPATLLYAIQSAAPTFKVQASAAEVSNRAKIKRAMSAIVIQPASLYISDLSSFGRTTWPRRAMCVGLTTLSKTRTSTSCRAKSGTPHIHA